MKKNYIVQAIAAILILGGITVAWQASQSTAEYPMAASERAPDGQTDRRVAPDFAMPDVDGKTVKLSDFEGDVRILDFWATWCPPCRKEIHHFQQLHETYGDKGLTIIGVSLDQNGADAVKPFSKQMKMTYTSLIGINNPEVAQAYGPIEFIPTAFVIDKYGRIYKKYVGYNDLATFENDIKKLLAE